MQEAEKFRELYVTEQEQRLDLESDLKDCKVSMDSGQEVLVLALSIPGNSLIVINPCSPDKP